MMEQFYDYRHNWDEEDDLDSELESSSHFGFDVKDIEPKETKGNGDFLFGSKEARGPEDPSLQAPRQSFPWEIPSPAPKPSIPLNPWEVASSSPVFDRKASSSSPSSSAEKKPRMPWEKETEALTDELKGGLRLKAEVIGLDSSGFLVTPLPSSAQPAGQHSSSSLEDLLKANRFSKEHIDSFVKEVTSKAKAKSNPQPSAPQVLNAESVSQSQERYKDDVLEQDQSDRRDSDAGTWGDIPPVDLEDMWLGQEGIDPVPTDVDFITLAKLCRAEAQERKGESKPEEKEKKASEEKRLKKWDDYLRARPEVLEEVDQKGRSLLYHACSAGNAEVVKLLLSSKKVDVNQANHEGFTPVFAACFNGHPEVVGLLLDHPRLDKKHVSNDKSSIFHAACDGGHEQVLEMLLEDPGIIKNGKKKGRLSALAKMCKERRVEVVRIILKSPEVNPKATDNEGRSPLHLTCLTRDLSLLEELLQYPESLRVNGKNANHETALHEACSLGFSEVVSRLLLCDEVDPDLETDGGDTPLHIATDKGQLEVVKVLIASPRVNPNKLDYLNRTALHLAALRGNLQITRMILTSQSHLHVWVQSRGEFVTHGKTAAEIATTPEIKALLTDYERDWQRVATSLRKSFGISQSGQVYVETRREAPEIQQLRADLQAMCVAVEERDVMNDRLHYEIMSQDSKLKKLREQSQVMNFSREELEVSTLTEERAGFGCVLREGTLLNIPVSIQKYQGVRIEKGRAALDILLRLRHRHLLNLFGFSSGFSEPDSISLVFPRMPPEQTLRKKLDQQTPSLSWLERVKIAKQITQALSCLEKLAPQVFFDQISTKSVYLNNQNDAVVADYWQQDWPMADRDHVCPEVQKGGESSELTVVYALGIIFAELLTGLSCDTKSVVLDKEPRSHLLYLVRNIEGLEVDPRGVADSITDAQFTIFVELIECLTSPKPEDRIDLDKILTRLSELL